MSYEDDARPDLLETGVSCWDYSPEEPEGQMSIDFYRNYSTHW